MRGVRLRLHLHLHLPLNNSLIMDPFQRLPWFFLQDTLCLLPDLSTLFQLYQASPAVFAFLRRNPRIFHTVVESIIAHPEPDRGLHPKAQQYLRICVLLWWRENEIQTGHQEPGTNPLPSSFDDVAFVLGLSSLDSKTLPPGLGDDPLPRTAPVSALGRLLGYSSRIHQLTHAFFHDRVAECLKLRPERMVDREEPFHDSLPRPRGTPITPVDIGPPIWLEEQRIILAVLRYLIFFELQRATKKNILAIGSQHPHFLTLERNDVHTFWERPDSRMRVARLRRGPEMMQLNDFVKWIQRDGALKVHQGHLHCCAERPSPILKERQESEILLLRTPGSYWIRKMYSWPRSPCRGMNCERFNQLGFGFWDEERMIALGFMVPLGMYPRCEDDDKDEKDIFFRWSSILNSDDEMRLQDA